MALKWKKKVYWIDEDDGKLYINPILALGSIALTAWIAWKLLAIG